MLYGKQITYNSIYMGKMNISLFCYPNQNTNSEFISIGPNLREIKTKWVLMFYMPYIYTQISYSKIPLIFYLGISLIFRLFLFFFSFNYILYIGSLYSVSMIFCCDIIMAILCLSLYIDICIL